MKKIHTYHVTLINGEVLESITIKGSLERNLSGIAKNFISVKDMNGKTVVLSKYHIVKAELINVEN